DARVRSRTIGEVEVDIARSTVAVSGPARGNAAAEYGRLARAAASVRHPALLEIYEIAEEGGDVFIVTEAWRGKTAAELLALARRVPPAQALWLLDAACGALEAAHARGVAHGRVSPALLLITDRGEAKLAGLGAAEADAEGCRADLRGLASCLYELATGSEPGPAFTAPSRRRPDLPPALDALLQDTLAPSAGPGIVSIGEFAARLRKLKDEVGRSA
ncbi:MAG: hypothetical protein NTX64_14125, partial [Elusimicrobia bacterium]|nr:hypothetical protein [Elusimicrobiota bacterium]